jgi:hypothetical protein
MLTVYRSGKLRLQSRSPTNPHPPSARILPTPSSARRKTFFWVRPVLANQPIRYDYDGRTGQLDEAHAPPPAQSDREDARGCGRAIRPRGLRQLAWLCRPKRSTWRGSPEVARDRHQRLSRRCARSRRRGAERCPASGRSFSTADCRSILLPRARISRTGQAGTGHHRLDGRHVSKRRTVESSSQRGDAKSRGRLPRGGAHRNGDSGRTSIWGRLSNSGAASSQ